ncbi:hypothetical protein CKO12_12040 [Chromatium okenii]|uniref:hypothetical protein n=1 Tax=Chromatium okenii TaxID=61644 RepID=UPI001906C215|nr:hypothetical protein [Chromatium okenii]MBK1642593.1 hypothetical protein [Chromatium okenii]
MSQKQHGHLSSRELLAHIGLNNEHTNHLLDDLTGDLGVALRDRHQLSPYLDGYFAEIEQMILEGLIEPSQKVPLAGNSHSRRFGARNDCGEWIFSF